MNTKKFLIFSLIMLAWQTCAMEVDVLKADIQPFMQEAKARQINILTLNTALLKVLDFGLIGKEVGLGRNKERAKMLGQQILAMKDRVDVLCFQESFDTQALAELYKIIKDVYPHALFDTRRKGWFLGVNSGLTMLSKYPIEASDRDDYTCFVGEESFARKGVLGALINVGGCRFYVFTTHLQAGGGSIIKALEWLTPKDCAQHTDQDLLDKIFHKGDYDPAKPPSTRHIAMMELVQAKKFIEQFTKAYPDAPRILTGDFNINSDNESREYGGFARIFEGIVDTHNPALSTRIGTAWRPGNTTTSYRIDYVFLLNPQQSGATGESEILEEFTQEKTDHLGVLGHVTVPCSPPKKLDESDFVEIKE